MVPPRLGGATPSTQKNSLGRKTFGKEDHEVSRPAWTTYEPMGVRSLSRNPFFISQPHDRDELSDHAVAVEGFLLALENGTVRCANQEGDWHAT